MSQGVSPFLEERWNGEGGSYTPPPRQRDIYAAYVLFHDSDAEPLSVEHVLDFEDRAEVFFMIDAAGNRWFIPFTSVRWIEVTPMEPS